MGGGQSKEQKEKARKEQDKLYQIALRFLRDPKVQSISEDSKINFLRQKGLSATRIKEAMTAVEKELKNESDDKK